MNVSFQARPGVPIYRIDASNNVVKYSSQAEAANDIGVNRNIISKCVSGDTYCTNGYVFVPVSDIEDENGNVDIQKVKKIKDERLAWKNIYSIDAYGNYQKYASQQEAADTLGIKPNHISRCVNGFMNFIKGVTFVFSNQVEIIDENGCLSVDKDKIDEIRQTRILNNSVFVIDKNGDTQIYYKISDAIRDKGLDKKETMIRNGLNFNNNEFEIDGYCFLRLPEISCDDEVK